MLNITEISMLACMPLLMFWYLLWHPLEILNLLNALSTIKWIGILLKVENFIYIDFQLLNCSLLDKNSIQSEHLKDKFITE